VLALREMGSEEENGNTIIKVKVSRQTIAQIVGASREMVGRVIKGLEDRGQLIENDDGTTILKQETAGLD
jgi:CRP-like cAMP-binding protein